MASVPNACRSTGQVRKTTAFVSLGSNLGDRKENLDAALRLMGERVGVRVAAVSAFIDTAPVGKTDQPRFLNAVAWIETTLPPAELLTALLDIETRLGRVRTEHWGPRTIDVDLLLYGRRIISEPNLAVPHPLMHERRFVLAPLAEIAPEAWHPVLKKTATQMLRDLAPGA